MMKRIISLFMTICLIVSLLSLNSVSAETKMEFEKDYACNKIFKVFNFTQSNYLKDLSSPPDTVLFDENNLLNFSFSSSTEESTMYFSVTKEESDLIQEIIKSKSSGVDILTGKTIETSYKLFLFTTMESENLSGNTGIDLSFKLIYDDETNCSVAHQFYQQPYTDENGNEFSVIPGLYNTQTEKQIKYICLTIKNPKGKDLSGAKGTVSSLKCSYGVDAHNIIIVDKTEPTCTQAGSSGKKHCTVCNQDFSISWAVKPKGHTVVTDKAVAPTCKKSGLTEGTHCSECSEVITPQKTIKATGHSYEWVVTKKATYFNKGKKSLKCKTCGKISKTKKLAKLKLETPEFKYTKGKGKFTVKYTKVKNATGFEVRYKLNGEWKTKTYNTKGSATKVIKNLKKGTYKVQIRAFIKSGKKAAYSDWTKLKTVKVK